MDNDMTITRTTLNGTKWEIARSFFGGYALYMENYKKDGYHFSGNIFNSLEEANAYLDRIDEKVLNPVKFTHCSDCSSFYGRGSNVYYGD